MTETQSRRYVSCAETAKYVRAALKAAFPGVKFSVRSNTYSGGASIDVSWTDGPRSADVDAVCRRYRGASFDGMTDSMSYNDTLLASADGGVEVVHFGANFVFAQRVLSDDYRGVLAAWAIHVLDHSFGHEGETFSVGLASTTNYGIACQFGVIDYADGEQLIRYLSQHVAPSGVPYNDRIEAY